MCVTGEKVYVSLSVCTCVCVCDALCGKLLISLLLHVILTAGNASSTMQHSIELKLSVQAVDKTASLPIKNGRFMVWKDVQGTGNNCFYSISCSYK